MTHFELLLTGHLARAARVLVGVSSAHTAQVAGIALGELREFERERTELSEEQRSNLQRALESLGAHFVADGMNGRGHGVRLKFSDEKSRRLESWEGEGGFAAEDDV